MTDIQIISLILLYQGLRGSLKGQADTIQTDPEYRDNGWLAKWKRDENGERIPIDLTNKNKLYRAYLKFYKIKFEEAFPLSSEWLVMFTDKWHFINWLAARSLEVTLCILANNYWLLLIQWLPAGVGFWLNFRKSKAKNTG